MESIKSNNLQIYEMITKILEQRRNKRISMEKDGTFDEDMKRILEMETEKCLAIYAIEFPKYQCQGKKGVTFVQGKETADCFGGTNGLQVTFGMQNFIDKKIMPSMQKLGYSLTENNQICFDSNNNDLHTHLSNNFRANTTKYVGSLSDQMDYFAYLFAINGVDMDWILDALPHEAMHTFGVIGGNAFLKEGMTEEFTREICEKYGIHMSATSHSQEAEFVATLDFFSFGFLLHHFFYYSKFPNGCFITPIV